MQKWMRLVKKNPGKTFTRRYIRRVDRLNLYLFVAKGRREEYFW